MKNIKDLSAEKFEVFMRTFINIPDAAPFRIDLIAWLITLYGNSIAKPFSDEQLIDRFAQAKEAARVLVTQQRKY